MHRQASLQGQPLQLESSVQFQDAMRQLHGRPHLFLRLPARTRLPPKRPELESRSQIESFSSLLRDYWNTTHSTLDTTLNLPTERTPAVHLVFRLQGNSISTYLARPGRVAQLSVLILRVGRNNLCVPHICSRTLRAYVGGDALSAGQPDVVFDFRF